MSPLQNNGVQPASAGVADSDEQQAARLAAVVEERRGYAARLAGAQDAGDAEAAAKMQERIAACDAVLGVTATAGQPKAKRATKRTKA